METHLGGQDITEMQSPLTRSSPLQVETPRLTLRRPSVYERPNLYVFTLDPASYNA